MGAVIYLLAWVAALALVWGTAWVICHPNEVNHCIDRVRVWLHQSRL